MESLHHIYSTPQQTEKLEPPEIMRIELSVYHPGKNEHFLGGSLYISPG
jgi:hypothetical protein